MKRGLTNVTSRKRKRPKGKTSLSIRCRISAWRKKGELGIIIIVDILLSLSLIIIMCNWNRCFNLRNESTYHMPIGTKRLFVVALFAVFSFRIFKVLNKGTFVFDIHVMKVWVCNISGKLFKVDFYVLPKHKYSNKIYLR